MDRSRSHPGSRLEINPAWSTARAIAATCRSSTSRSSNPSSCATESWSRTSGRSVARPARACSTSRTSISADRASSNPWCGQSATQEAATARITTRSRSPPRDSLRSGVVAKANAPERSARSSQLSRNAVSRFFASARQSASTRRCSVTANSGSPAMCRRSSMPSMASRSVLAICLAPPTERTEWSSLILESQIGYHIRSASMPAYDAGVSVECNSTRSRSENGESSPLPYPPTATSATPPTFTPASWASSPSQPSVSLDRARRRAGPVTPVRLSNCAHSSGKPPAVPTGVVGMALQGFLTALAGAHADHRLDGNGPDLAVTDLPGASRPDDHVADVVDVLVVHQDLQANLRKQLHRVLRAPVDLGVTTLPAVAR